MNISISNIAWETYRTDEHLRLLKDLGCSAIELSPSMVFASPTTATTAEWLSFKKYVNSFGLSFSSMHSLTYPRPDLTFFHSEETRKELILYIESLGKIGSMLEIPVMVYGSSKSRQLGNDHTRATKYKLFVETLHNMSERLAPLGVMLLIEPLAKEESDNINNLDEAYSLLKEVNHTNFGLHADIRASIIEKEDHTRVWEKYGKLIKHCHIANPGFKPPSDEFQDHHIIATAIKNASYTGYISGEIGRRGVDTITTVKETVNYIRRVYLNK